jgi:CDP-Glycerol:Poly(glycerophosphate) glycerophosphotransferase
VNIRSGLLDVVRRVDYATRRSSRRILVDSRTPVNFAMVLPVVRLMAVDDRVQFWFTASEEPQSLAEIYRERRDVRLIQPGAALLRRWDAYLTSDFMWATLPRCDVRVQMFHGVAGKYGFDAPTESMRHWDRLFFVNERRLRNFIAAGAIDADSPAARLIGMPKVDCLVDGSLRRDEVLRTLELDPSRPTVLYAPTWSPASSLNRMGIELIEALTTKPINLIVKLHDRSCDLRPQYSGGVDWVAKVKATLAAQAAKGAADAVLATGANIAPCLTAADAMISDYSSAAFEYLLLDRPLVRIEIIELMNAANVHPAYAQLLSEASHTVFNAAGAASMVEYVLSVGDERSAARRSVSAELFYKPGTATARCASALYEVLEIAPHRSIACEANACLQSA